MTDLKSAKDSFASRRMKLGSAIFNVLFFVITVVFVLAAVVLSLLPGRRAMMRVLQSYTRTLVAAFEEFCGVDVEVRGREHLRTIDENGGACIIAPKHQSYGDGPLMFSEVKDISFVADNHIAKSFIMRRVLGKIGAVMVDNQGGPEQRERMQRLAGNIREQGRKLLIYPEGHLSKVGTHHRYRKGIYHLYRDFDCPVVPVATNLGQRWNQNRWTKWSGGAVLEFLEPIPAWSQPGAIHDKDAFMAELQRRVETRSLELLDMDNPGALEVGDIGKLEENERAREKREAREAAEGRGA